MRGNCLRCARDAFLTSKAILRCARSIGNNKYVISLFAVNDEEGEGDGPRSSANPENVWHEKIPIAARSARLFADYISSMTRPRRRAEGGVRKRVNEVYVNNEDGWGNEYVVGRACANGGCNARWRRDHPKIIPSSIAVGEGAGEPHGPPNYRKTSSTSRLGF